MSILEAFVSDSSNSDDHILSDLFPDIFHMSIDRSIVDIVAVSHYFVHELFSGDDRSLSFYNTFENIKL